MDEELEVFRHRQAEAVEAGFTAREALIFGESKVDVGQLRSLVRDGCPLKLIRKIVL